MVHEVGPRVLVLYEIQRFGLCSRPRDGGDELGKSFFHTGGSRIALYIYKQSGPTKQQAARHTRKNEEIETSPHFKLCLRGC